MEATYREHGNFDTNDFDTIEGLMADDFRFSGPLATFSGPGHSRFDTRIFTPRIFTQLIEQQIRG